MQHILLAFLTATTFLSAGPRVIRLAPSSTPVIQRAIDSLGPDSGFTVIELAPGIYREKVTLSKNTPPVRLVGKDAATTRIVWNDHAKTSDGKGGEIGTFRSSSVTIDSDGFSAEGITFENDHGPGVQAVAISIGGDRAVFRDCQFLGWQDTLLVRRKRHYFQHCRIEGSVDFIFGDATAYFDDCAIHCRDKGYLTAASTPEDQEFGFVFSRCRVTAEAGVELFLGRPWRSHSSVHFLACEFPAGVRPEGWDNWRKAENERTARYFEWQNTGPGADRSKRVAWLRPLDDAQGRGLQRPWRVFNKWDPNANVSPERVSRLPGDEQTEWWQYLELSKQEMSFSQEKLRGELLETGLDSPAIPEGKGSPPSWKRDREWFRSDEARELAAAIVSYQTPAGAWSKALDYSRGPRPIGTHWSSQGGGKFPWHYVGTIDNKATTSEIRFLAAFANATRDKKATDAVLAGIDYLLDSQYPNGGWPQVWPLEGGYHDLVTLNDDAMVKVMELLLEVSERKEPFSLVDPDRRRRAGSAVKSGLSCLREAQVRIDDKPTIWCGQHDPLTLAPACARMQEPAALTTGESAVAVRFLDKHFGSETRETCDSARAWFRDHAVTGIRFHRDDDGFHYEEGTGDKELWWARFHDLETQKPVFPGAQDGGIHATFAEMAKDNGIGYKYYTDQPRELLEQR